MIKKNMLLLLLAVSSQVPHIMAETTTDVETTVVETVSAVPVDADAQLTVESTQTTQPTTETTPAKKRFTLPNFNMPQLDPAWSRTAQRSALLFVAHNALNKTYTNDKLKDGFFWGAVNKNVRNNKFNTLLRLLSDYLYIVAKYAINTHLPKATDATSNEIVEWVAGEYVAATAYDEKGAEKADAKHKKIGRMVLKAASRKQLWLPDESSTKAAFKFAIPAMVLAGSEKGVFKAENLRYAAKGMIAAGVAEDLLAYGLAKNKLPKFVYTLVQTDAGWNLCKDLLTQFIEDFLNYNNKREDLNLLAGCTDKANEIFTEINFS